MTNITTDAPTMELFLDDQLYLQTDAPPATVEELISNVRHVVRKQDRIVIALATDGRVVHEAQLGELFRQSPAEFQRLDLRTASIPELARESLHSAGAILGAVRTEHSRIVEYLTHGEVQQAIELLAETVHALSLVHHTLSQTIELLGLNLDQLSCEGQKACDVLTAVARPLGELKDCLNSSDYVLLNDLLKHDLGPVLDGWDRLICAIAGQISQSPRRAGG